MLQIHLRRLLIIIKTVTFHGQLESTMSLYHILSLILIWSQNQQNKSILIHHYLYNNCVDYYLWVKWTISAACMPLKLTVIVLIENFIYHFLSNIEWKQLIVLQNCIWNWDNEYHRFGHRELWGRSSSKIREGYQIKKKNRKFKQYFRIST